MAATGVARKHLVVSRTLIGGMAAVVVTALVTVLESPSDDPALRGPLPHLSPAQVVRLQLRALGQNSSRDEGIAAAYRFASPGNRNRTGTLARFALLVRSEPYRPLLNHLNVRYGTAAAIGDRRYLPVIVTDRLGVSTGYLWVLSRVSAGACIGCWTTESVLLIGDLQRLRFA